jgi:predicted membrane chloride channel (bestrophin family)
MVLPYCILNVGIYFLINWLNEKEHIHIDISSQGHSLMSLIIAFLGVSKVNIALTRYMDSKQAIENAVLSLREISQLAIAITERDKSPQAQLWREEVSQRSTDILSTTTTTVFSFS